jgi:outer membrane protein assembly factor BamD|tara:strand:- start:609 stop:1451 length:843 start_codon:yes stop_codon:yes gene_type:complete
MKLIYKLIIILFLFTLFSCSKDIKSISEITEVNQELELVNTYQDGMNALEEGDYFFASEKFLESELLFPQSIWAPKSVLMAAYSLYMLDNYSDAKFNLERYIDTYPKDKNMAYAYYLLGMVYYENIVDQTRDQEPLLNSKKQFELVISEFKDTEFALDSKFKLDMINDILASKEMYVGRHYIKSKKWIAAINRFKTVIKEYETTIYVEEAIHRLVEIHYHIGLTKEAEKYANLLGYNYLSSEWYKKSYKLFNKDFKILNLKKNKTKEKNILTKFFKKLFE